MNTENIGFDLAQELISGAQDRNNVMATAQVHFLVRDHYVDAANGIFGIQDLIVAILKTNNAVFPANIENTPLRQIALGTSLTTDEIIETVRENFGIDRYPDNTIRMYLSVHGGKKSKTPIFGKIQMTKTEDSNRTCSKPRCKWYVISPTTTES